MEKYKEEEEDERSIKSQLRCHFFDSRYNENDDDEEEEEDEPSIKSQLCCHF